MQAMILNSGTGSRLGDITTNRPKCMIEIAEGVTLLSHQIEALAKAGVTEFLITTGYLAHVLQTYIHEKYNDAFPVRYVHNPSYSTTNYIYSMYLASSFVREDLVLVHGDLYFEEQILYKMLAIDQSCVVIDSTSPLPEKDFAAEVKGNRVAKIATHLTGPDCVACQPLYVLRYKDWQVWADAIARFCEAGRAGEYAETALNTVLDRVHLLPFDVKGDLCMEVDTPEDLMRLARRGAR